MLGQKALAVSVYEVTEGFRGRRQRFAEVVYHAPAAHELQSLGLRYRDEAMI
jgi:hypothetical protein